MSGSVDPKQFWERKIVAWERGRYGRTESNNLLEMVADRASASLRFRQQIALDLLGPMVAGRRVIELGCGSALLAEKLIAAGAASYLGLDIGYAALAETNRRLADAGLADHARIEFGDVTALPAIKGDVVFSLGLLDWLTLGQIEAMLAATAGMDFIHSISEKRASLAQAIHRLYVYLAYGRKTGSYVPQYYAADAIAALARGHGATGVWRVRHPTLQFGALLTGTNPGAKFPASVKAL